MSQTLTGGHFEVERGPDWLFIRPSILAEDVEETLAEQVWSLLECHMIYRVVLELDGIELLNSRMVGQLVKLKKKVHTHGGVLRLCGLNTNCQEVLSISRLGDQLHSFSTRTEAVLGPRPLQPR